MNKLTRGQKRKLRRQGLSPQQPTSPQVNVLQEQRTEYFRMHQGPVPDPQTMEAYGRTQADFPERLMKQFELEAAHRRDTEAMIVQGKFALSKRGQVFGLIIGLAGMGVAAYVAKLGHPWAGATIAALDVLGLVSVFVTGRTQQKPAASTKQE